MLPLCDLEDYKPDPLCFGSQGVVTATGRRHRSGASAVANLTKWFSHLCKDVCGGIRKCGLEKDQDAAAELDGKFWRKLRQGEAVCWGLSHSWCTVTRNFTPRLPLD